QRQERRPEVAARAAESGQAEHQEGAQREHHLRGDQAQMLGLEDHVHRAGTLVADATAGGGGAGDGAAPAGSAAVWPAASPACRRAAISVTGRSRIRKNGFGYSPIQKQQSTIGARVMISRRSRSLRPAFSGLSSLPNMVRWYSHSMSAAPSTIPRAPHTAQNLPPRR